MIIPDIQTWDHKYLLIIYTDYLYLGGYDGRNTTIYLSEVSRYDPSSETWVETSNMQTPRQNHGISAVDWDEIAPFCN